MTKFDSVRTQVAALPDVTIDDHVTFADLTTFRVGGAPAATVYCQSLDAVVAVVRLLDDADVPLLIVGGGSNLVVGDNAEADAEAGDHPVGDLVAVVIAADAISLTTEGTGLHTEAALVEAEAGAVWDDVVDTSVAAGFGGLECLSGIPGSAGATPVQNVGAYGVEVSQVLDAVRLYDRQTQEDQWVAPEALELAYRYSNLKFTSRGVVLAVRFRLSSDGLSAPLRYGELARRLGVTVEENAAGAARRPAQDVRDAVLALRAGKGMVSDPADHDTWSAGSFFTNPIVDEATAAQVRDVVAQRFGAEIAEAMPQYPAVPDPATGALRVKLSAAWLIEKAGFAKGFPGEDAPARLSTKHTLALTNRGAATTADVVALARRVVAGVADTFGVTLEPEPLFIGVSL